MNLLRIAILYTLVILSAELLQAKEFCTSCQAICSSKKTHWSQNVACLNCEINKCANNLNYGFILPCDKVFNDFLDSIQDFTKANCKKVIESGANCTDCLNILLNQNDKKGKLGSFDNLLNLREHNCPTFVIPRVKSAFILDQEKVKGGTQRNIIGQFYGNLTVPEINPIDSNSRAAKKYKAICGEITYEECFKRVLPQDIDKALTRFNSDHPDEGWDIDSVKAVLYTNGTSQVEPPGQNQSKPIGGSQ